MTIFCNRRFRCVWRCLSRCIASRFGPFPGVGTYLQTAGTLCPESGSFGGINFRMWIRLSRVLKGLPLFLRPSDEERAVLVNHLDSLHLTSATRAHDVGPRHRDDPRCVATSKSVRPASMYPYQPSNQIYGDATVWNHPTSREGAKTRRESLGSKW